MIPSFASSRIHRFVDTQGSSLYEQACAGVRAFDIRLTVDKDDRLHVHHTFIGDSLSRVLKDLFKFLDEHKEEIVFLDFRCPTGKGDELREELNKWEDPNEYLFHESVNVDDFFSPNSTTSQKSSTTENETRAINNVSSENNAIKRTDLSMNESEEVTETIDQSNLVEHMQYGTSSNSEEQILNTQSNPTCSKSITNNSNESNVSPRSSQDHELTNPLSFQNQKEYPVKEIMVKKTLKVRRKHRNMITWKKEDLLLTVGEAKRLGKRMIVFSSEEGFIEHNMLLNYWPNVCNQIELKRYLDSVLTEKPVVRISF